MKRDLTSFLRSVQADQAHALETMPPLKTSGREQQFNRYRKLGEVIALTEQTLMLLTDCPDDVNTPADANADF